MKNLIKTLLPVLWCVSQAVLAIPDIQTWKTANGADVYFTSAKEIPIVDIRIIFDAGSARDGAKPGLASLTNGLLREGAGKMDADMIAKRLDNIGARLTNGSLRDMAWIELRTLSRQEALRDGMDLLTTILSRPTFPEDAFERDRRNMLVNLQASKQKPGTIAKKAFMKAVYGDHPYASPPDGTEESINALTLSDVNTYYDKYYVARNMTIAIVGAVTRSEAGVLAEMVSNDLKSGNKPQPIPVVQELIEAGTIHMEYPSSQTHIWVGQPGINRNDDDYFQLYTGNHSFGGSGLVSQLSDEMREKRGYAYSAYSYFSPMREAGPFTMVAQTKNTAANDALNVMKNTLQLFIDKGISKKQLTASKQNITGGFALLLDSNRKLLQNLSIIGFYKLPTDYLSTFNSHVNAVTRDQIIDAFRRRVHPDKMVTVIVGPKQIDPQ